MTLFTAATAAALEAPATDIPLGVYSYMTEVQFEVKATGNNAPALLLRILQKLVVDEPSIVFCDAARDPIQVDDFPSTKDAFNAVFSTSTSNSKLSCRFEIRSSRKSFHTVKIGVWELLQQHKIWFRKSPGPLKRLPLSMLGFWVNMHPGFASPSSIIEEVKADLAHNYPRSTDVVKKYGLPTTFTPPEIYIARGRVYGQYHTTTDTGEAAPALAIDADAMITYSGSPDFHCTLVMLTQIASSKNPRSPASPMFIPFALKKADPLKFGHYLSMQNLFMKQHRNIAIVGVVPNLMDLANSAGDTLWESIRTLPGVF